MEEVRIQSDARTNSLIITASKDKMDLIRQVVEQLDVNMAPDIKVEVFKLEYADSSTVAEELNQIMEQPQGSASSSRFRFPWSRSSSSRSQQRIQGMTGLRENIIVPDVRNNSLIVTGTEENLVEIGELIVKLDVVSPLTDIVRVYPLENANAEDVANTLERVFRGGGQSRGFFSFLFGSRSGQSGAATDILREIQVEGDEATNSLVVTAPPQAHEIVESMIEELDKPHQQVFIQVAIVDVTLDDTTRLGVEWSWATEGEPQDTVGTNFDVAVSPNFAQGLRYTVVGREFNAVLNALMEKHEVRVLSTPLITTTDNVQAKVEIGTKYPYVERISQNATGQIPQFGWYDITVSLEVTPRIKTAISVPEKEGEEPVKTHRIQMEIVQTLNELQGELAQMGFTMPIVGTRTADTTVTVADGQTIVLGGMIREASTTIKKKVPILGDLPIIGSLFRSTDDRVTNNELLVFLMPRVLKNDADIEALTDEWQQRVGDIKLKGLLDDTTETKVQIGNEQADQPAEVPQPPAGPSAAPAPPAATGATGEPAKA